MLSRLKLLVIALLLSACQGPQGPQVHMDFQRSMGLYDAPFPSEDLRHADGSVDVGHFPNPQRVAIIDQLLALIARDSSGFALSGGVFFSLTADLGASPLPDLAGSTSADAQVFLMDLSRSARTPVVVRYAADGGSFGAPYLLSLLPLQGIPLRPGKTYAAVVRRGLTDVHGQPVVPAPAMTLLAGGGRPAGLSDAAYAAYQGALTTLAQAGIPPGEIAGLAVFSTGVPEAAMGVFRQDVLSRPLPAALQAFTRSDVFPDYCVYNSLLDVPDYQQGTAPYLKSGGDWVLGPGGKPLAPHMERARIVVTVPRQPAPAGGFPTVVLIRAGAGGDRPLVDRGVQAVQDGPPVVPGSGPAREFARVGFAGIQVDNPLGGLRNTTNGNEDYLIFNILNAAALRDNVRETALETVLLAHIAPTLAVDASDCPGAGGMVHFDGGRLALMGHSIGATVAPLALAWEPLYRAGIFSGAGGSYIENVLYKRKPVAVLPAAEALLGYSGDQDLSESDPVLTLLQWATEPADPQVYAHRIVREPDDGAAPRHVLMEQGIVDHYILPDIANAVSLPLGLDLGGMPLDHGKPGLEDQTPVLDVLPLVGHGRIDLPASGNVMVSGKRVTALLVQHPEDGIEDGHEVVFQTEAPKHQYRCFLLGLKSGTVPVVPPDGMADAPCP